MGQAKLRGPRESRVAEAIERNEAARIADEQRKAEARLQAEVERQQKLDAMTDGDRAVAVARYHAGRRSSMRSASLMGALLMLAAMPDTAQKEPK